MPGFGATEAKKLQLSVGWRYARAHRSYFDSRFNRTFTKLWNPFERLSILDVSARYAFTPRASLIVGVPIVINRFSVRLPPLGALGRQEHWQANGLGDISVYGQRWMLDSKNSPFQNIALGVGVKIPSDNWYLKATIPDETGFNSSRRAVYPASEFLKIPNARVIWRSRDKRAGEQAVGAPASTFAGRSSLSLQP